MSSQRGARNKLADVLADIKNSRTEDADEVVPTPPKRRSAVNYVALSGHVPRQSRSQSNNNNTELKNAATTNAISSTPKKRTYILRLFDRTVDLAPFSGENGREDVPLYPVCRAWVHGRQPTKEGRDKSSLKQQIKIEKSISSPSTNQLEQAQPEAPAEVLSLPSPKTKADIIKHYKFASKDPDIDVRIPQSVRDFKAPSDIEETVDKFIQTMDHRECLEENKLRWKKVRRDWSEARRIHESRYEESFKVLHDIFMSAQRGV